MARTEYRYKPLDLDNDKAIGIQLPFNYKKGLFKLSYTTEEQAISNLKNLILTNKGERFGQPNLGTDLRKFLFENNTQTLGKRIRENLYADIGYWLPYIKIEDIIVDVGSVDGIEGHALKITFHFSVTEQGANQIINILVTTRDGVIFL